jgi:hypothetical protein
MNKISGARSEVDPATLARGPKKGKALQKFFCQKREVVIG